MRKFVLANEEIDPVSTLLTFVAGTAGGFAFKALGAPLPMLLGSVIVVGAISILAAHPGGRPPKVPMWLRYFFIPIIGLSIGAAFTPAIADEFGKWWPSLLALFFYIPLAHYVGYVGYRHLGGLSPSTAYYAAVPGGLIEVITMGEEAGADRRMLTALQFMRLILTIMVVPLAFTIFSGGAVGSAAGAELAHPIGAVLDGKEIALQVLIGAAGFFVGRRLGLPASVITGPILFSGVAHLTGVLTAAPPRYLIEVTQVVMGVSLGTRFVGMRPRAVLHALLLAAVNMAATLALAIIAGLTLHQLVGERIEAVVLAFAPGGLAEMSLVAVSLHISIIYVSTHHVMRIVLAVTVAKLFARRIPRDDPDQHAN